MIFSYSQLLVIPGCAGTAQARNPNFRAWLRIPGSRFARPGTTAPEVFLWSMTFSKNRYALFRIML
jgi:hypothetical protein